MSPEDFAAELAEHTFDKEAVGGAPGMDYSGHTYHGRQRLEAAAAPKPQPKVDAISGATRNVTPRRPPVQPKPTGPITRYYEPRLGMPENAPTQETQLDRLATQGIRFNGGYNASPSGTPSRASMIRGYSYPSATMPSRATMIAQQPLREIEYKPMLPAMMNDEQLQAHKKWQMEQQLEQQKTKMEQRRKMLSSRASRLFDAGYRYDPENDNWVNAEGDTHPAGDVRPYSLQSLQGNLEGEEFTPPHPVNPTMPSRASLLMNDAAKRQHEAKQQNLARQKQLIQRDWTGAPFMAGMVTPSGVIPADPSGMSAPGFGDNVNQNVAALVALGHIKTPSEAAKYRSAVESGVEFTPETFAQQMKEYQMPPTPPPQQPATPPKPPAAAPKPMPTPATPPAPNAGAGPPPGPPATPPAPGVTPPVQGPAPPPTNGPSLPGFDVSKYLPPALRNLNKPPETPEGWHPPMAPPGQDAPSPPAVDPNAPPETTEPPPNDPAATPEKSFGGFSEALGSLFGGKGLGDAWGQLTGGGKMGVGGVGGLLLILLLSKLFGKRGSIEDYTAGEIKRANDLMDQMMGKAAFTSPGVKAAPRFSRRGRGMEPEKKFVPGHNFQGSTAKRIQPMNNVRETGADKKIDQVVMGKSAGLSSIPSIRTLLMGGAGAGIGALGPALFGQKPSLASVLPATAAGGLAGAIGDYQANRKREKKEKKGAFHSLTKNAFLAWGGGSAGLHPKGRGIGGEIGYTNVLGMLPIPLGGIDIGGPKKGFQMGVTPDPGSDLGVSPYLGMRWNHPRRTGITRNFPRGLPEVIYDKLKGRTKEDAIRKSYPDWGKDEEPEIVDEVADDDTGELAEVDDDSEVEAAKEAAVKLAMKPLMAVRIKQRQILAVPKKKTRTPSVKSRDNETASTTDMAKSKDRKGEFAVT